MRDLLLSDKNFEILVQMDDWWVVRAKNVPYNKYYYYYLWHNKCGTLKEIKASECIDCNETTPKDVAAAANVISGGKNTYDIYKA